MSDDTPQKRPDNTWELTDRLMSLERQAKQMDLALDGFIETFSSHFFVHSEVQRAARQIAEMRGREDIVKRIDDHNKATPVFSSSVT